MKNGGGTIYVYKDGSSINIRQMQKNYVKYCEQMYVIQEKIGSVILASNDYDDYIEAESDPEGEMIRDGKRYKIKCRTRQKMRLNFDFQNQQMIVYDDSMISSPNFIYNFPQSFQFEFTFPIIYSLPSSGNFWAQGFERGTYTKTNAGYIAKCVGSKQMIPSICVFDDIFIDKPKILQQKLETLSKTLNKKGLTMIEYMPVDMLSFATYLPMNLKNITSLSPNVIIGSGCFNIQIQEGCKFIQIGNNCHDITISSSQNVFIKNNSSNIFILSSENVNIGQYCEEIDIFGNNVYIGNTSKQIRISGNTCSDSTDIGNDCYNIQILQSNGLIVLKDSVKNISIKRSQNVLVQEGCGNESDINIEDSSMISIGKYSVIQNSQLHVFNSSEIYMEGDSCLNNGFIDVFQKCNNIKIGPHCGSDFGVLILQRQCEHITMGACVGQGKGMVVFGSQSKNIQLNGIFSGQSLYLDGKSDVKLLGQFGDQKVFTKVQDDQFDGTMEDLI